MKWFGCWLLALALSTRGAGQAALRGPLPALPAVVAKPVGVFSASGAQNATVMAQPQVKGALVRAPWNMVEPTPGVYDWTFINLAVNQVKAAGKKWSLAVLAGPATPAWLYTAPYNAPRIQYLFQGITSTMSAGWHGVVRERLQALAQALAAQFGNDPDLQLVYVTQMTANGIEGQLPFDAQLRPPGTTWASLGWTAAAWVSATVGTAQDFAAAFPNQALAVELHYVLNDATIPAAIGNALCADPALAGRVGIAIWWLSGRTTYQPELLDYFAQSTCDKYGQVIGSSDQPERFPPEGYGAVFTQAKALRLRYMEPWEQEFTTLCCQWEAAFADFNIWAAANFGGAPATRPQYLPLITR